MHWWKGCSRREALVLSDERRLSVPKTEEQAVPLQRIVRDIMKLYSPGNALDTASNTQVLEV